MGINPIQTVYLRSVLSSYDDQELHSQDHPLPNHATHQAPFLSDTRNATVTRCG